MSTRLNQIWFQHIKSFGFDFLRAYWTLIKIMVPALIIVKVLEFIGATELLAELISPLMLFIGLPPEFGLVWAASLLTNIYTAMVVFYEMSNGQVFSVAEMSTLAIMILVGHAIPVEGAVAKLLHVPWRLTVLLRIVGAYVFGGLTMLGYFLLDTGNQPATILWEPEVQEADLLSWSLAQIEMFAMIFIILASLMAMMRLLRLLHVERLLTWLLQPLTRVLTVGKDAANITIIGLLLGLSFGAGLLVAEAKKGHIAKRDIILVTCFLGLCHSVIEDTILMLLIGADILPILVGRFVLSVLVIAVMARTLFKKVETAS